MRNLEFTYDAAADAAKTGAAGVTAWTRTGWAMFLRARQ